MGRHSARKRPVPATRPTPPHLPAVGYPSLTLPSFAVGLAVVAVTAVPSLFNPRGHDAFTVVKTGLIEGLGPPALFCAIFLLLFQRRTLLADSLVRASAAVALTI